jgi:hypothetical protein
MTDPAVRVPFDPRYKFSAIRVEGDRVETRSHFDAIVFAADDPLLSVMIAEYLAVGRESPGADIQCIREMEGVLRRLSAEALPTKRKRRKKP